MAAKKKIKIVKRYKNLPDDTYTFVLNSSRLNVEIYDEDKTYPEGTFYMTMPDGMEFRYAFIPYELPEEVGDQG